jgi:hypothetical protein
MTDMGQQNLREPERVDWDTAFSGSKYTPPPVAIGPDGKYIAYQAKVVEIKESPGQGLDQGYLNYEINLKLVGNGVDGTSIKTWASTRTFTKRQPDGSFVNVKGNPNQLAKFLRSCGLQGKPVTNADYQQAVKQVANKTVSISIDWEARNKETGEMVTGYNLFPEDLERPGTRKSILKRGDILTDERVVASEVLFANARVKYFNDATPRVGR